MTERGGRTERPVRSDEVATLRGFLGYQRDTFRAKTAGLDRDQLAATIGPSTMTLAGMTKHLALVEYGWFTEGFAGEPMPAPYDAVDWDADRDWDWHSALDDSPEDLRALLDEAIARSDRVVDDALANGGLEQESDEVDELRGRYSLRWIIVHMIEEYARHIGHADLIRESVDGSTGQ